MITKKKSTNKSEWKKEKESESESKSQRRALNKSFICDYQGKDLLWLLLLALLVKKEWGLKTIINPPKLDHCVPNFSVRFS